MSTQKINCPKCGESISIDDVLTRQIESKIRKDFEASQKNIEEELILRSEELSIKEAELAKSKKDIDAVIAKKVDNQIVAERLKLFKEARKEAEKAIDEKTSFLEEQLKNKDQKLAQANKNELELRKEKIKLEEDKRSFELEKLRQLEEERETIFAEASKKATAEQHYVIAQLKKQLSDATKAKDELARKLEQGSQQTQGEVLELELEDILKAQFPLDEILPVGKGVSGADIIQKVTDRSGRICGQIVWESKKTKAWSENWIQKLKDDQRKKKAELAVIVSTVLPEGVNGSAYRSGVWVCDIKYCVALATALRMNLEAVTREKSISVGKNEKMEFMYDYLTGVEFRQRVEAIVEAFSNLDNGLRKERLAFEKIWAEREKQIKKAMISTVGMYGEMSGLITLPAIKNLELGDGVGE